MTPEHAASYATLFPEIAGYTFTPMTIGESGASVYRLTRASAPVFFLKDASGRRVEEVVAEHARLLWLDGRAQVPRVRGFVSSAGRVLLLTEALPGSNAAEAPRQRWPHLVTALATALRSLHALPVADCPFDRTLDVVIAVARAHTAAGLVDEENFDDERKGARARDLLPGLDRERPTLEDIVITHGDACLPNAIFDGDRFSGFVDCGRSGLADRYQDLALASRSIASNFGPEHVERFFAAYGLANVDERKLAYYRLVDEFF